MKLLSLGSAFSCAAIFFSMTAQAGGLYIREFGQPTQAMAGAGAQVMAEDASTAFQNAAGVFLLEGDSEWMVSGVALFSKVEFDVDESKTTIPGSDGGDAGSIAVGAGAFHTRKLNDKWGLTFSLNSVAGSALGYDKDFVGRYEGYDVDLLTVTFAPSVAYRINEDWSIAAGVPMTYGQLELTAAIPPLLGAATPDRDGKAEITDGDDFEVTVSFNVLWQVSDTVRLGASYLGKTEMDFSSDTKITLPGAGSGVSKDNINTTVEIKLPQVLATSALWDVNDKLTLTTRLAIEDWSELDSVPISTSQRGAAIPVNWDDVWSVALGMRYKAEGPWTYYTGVSYDSSPGSASDRLVILPIDEQWRFAGGFTYALKDKRKIGVSVSWVELGDAPINRTTDVGSFGGDFSTNRIIFLGMNYSWR